MEDKQSWSVTELPSSQSTTMDELSIDEWWTLLQQSARNVPIKICSEDLLPQAMKECAMPLLSYETTDSQIDAMNSPTSACVQEHVIDMQLIPWTSSCLGQRCKHNSPGKIDEIESEPYVKVIAKAESGLTSEHRLHRRITKVPKILQSSRIVILPSTQIQKLNLVPLTTCYGLNMTTSARSNIFTLRYCASASLFKSSQEVALDGICPNLPIDIFGHVHKPRVKGEKQLPIKIPELFASCLQHCPLMESAGLRSLPICSTIVYHVDENKNLKTDPPPTFCNKLATTCFGNRQICSYSHRLKFHEVQSTQSEGISDTRANDQSLTSRTTDRLINNSMLYYKTLVQYQDQFPSCSTIRIHERHLRYFYNHSTSIDKAFVKSTVEYDGMTFSIIDNGQVNMDQDERDTLMIKLYDTTDLNDDIQIQYITTLSALNSQYENLNCGSQRADIKLTGHFNSATAFHKVIECRKHCCGGLAVTYSHLRPLCQAHSKN